MNLLVCQRNDEFQRKTGASYYSGLYPSCWHIEQFFSDVKTVSCHGVADLEQVIETLSPKKVIIQAIWLPEKDLNYLRNTYRDTLFYIHIRSDIPFLDVQANAIKYLKSAKDQGFGIIVNSRHCLNSLYEVLGALIYLPNLYSIPNLETPQRADSEVLNVACLGAIRLMKNVLVQALGAIKYCEIERKTLHFHINTSRLDVPTQNLEEVFKGTRHKLVPVKYLERDEIYEFLQKMDLGMQVSMSESFNMVTADYVVSRIPIVVSEQIEWVEGYKVPINNSLMIRLAIELALKNTHTVKNNLGNLEAHNKKALEKWQSFLA